ncbi:hypothetical protein K450DRAFT_249826 [Umbelopsis ramanniana AG]|uniref:Uncharacterized protein n=1 Tax=Umbelopsis ramanniana AG TaxID=1314678 RepID=A0AAD5E940_UMBRA|nr:uncharacterized protein K450DRAFT_249826 [Umbelopsis ramanniana AG]KAI8577900.1 hypothetical protein K450DRAFT_249826 [Umbelopsis ramanniana AG]
MSTLRGTRLFWVSIWSTKWIAQILSMFPFRIHLVCMSLTSCKRPRPRRIESYN